MNNKEDYEKELKIEQEKLDLLIQSALNGPIVNNDGIITQSRKVDSLIEKMCIEKEINQK